MKHTKLAVLAMSTALILTGCSAPSMDKTKSKLEENNYTVKIYTEAEYDELPESELIMSPFGLEYYLNAVNNEDSSSVLVSWYFDTIDNAGSFYDLSSAWLSDVFKLAGGSGSPKVGQNNSVVYCGSSAAVKIAGY